MIQSSAFDAPRASGSRRFDAGAFIQFSAGRAARRRRVILRRLVRTSLQMHKRAPLIEPLHEHEIRYSRG
jgi:hypothetical protein